MNTLIDVQRGFIQGVLSPDEAWIASRMSGAGNLEGSVGLSIYRNNILSNYRRALHATYPVVVQLVGISFFNRAVDEYSMGIGIDGEFKHGDLGQFGHNFGNFLATYFPAADLVYLPDIARLEWAIEQSFHSEQSSGLDRTALSQTHPDQWAQLRFMVAPSTFLLSSPYPVLRIWEVNQPDHVGDQRVDLLSGSMCLLGANRSFEVAVEPISESEYVWLVQLSQGASLEQATQASLEVDVDFDVQCVLQQRLLDETLVDFYTN